MKSLPFFLFLASLALAPLAPAQQEPTEDGDPAEETENPNVSESDGPERFWEASLPGGHYMVALDRIATISRHQYLLDATALITEVTIDTNGRALARFYHIAPVTDSMDRNEVTRLAERGRDLIERAGQRAGTTVQDMAAKTYPATTHAGTIEFRLLDRRNLDSLYESLRKSWVTGRGRTLTIK